MNIKFDQFNSAIEKYNTIPWYTKFETLLSVIVILCQSLSVINLFHTYDLQGYTGFLGALLLAYIATDFVNGLVHMIVDNNSSYTSIFGPFIAAFHVHHYKLRYKDKHSIKIYFYESGHKFWLVIYLLLLVYVQQMMHMSQNLNLGLVFFGIFSSIAELSHYWCHKQKGNNIVITSLQKYHLLLSFKHHRLHHINDNMNYAFLNGMSDPLLNLIARHCYRGYKNQSDLHVTAYFKKIGTLP
ncbi:MAG: hypothetical protein HKM04_07440 [Legionellales bacterium]|nr:hypothetical protein [Legionellales bacterium]